MNETVYAAEILAIRHRHAPQRRAKARVSTSPFHRRPFAFCAFWVIVAIRLGVIRPVLLAFGRPVD